MKNLRQQCEGNYKKYRSHKKIDEFEIRYEQWQKYFKTHKSDIRVTIGRAEIEKFWFWFESRLDAHSESNGGVQIERMVTDFVDYGVVSSTTEARKLLRRIDEDASGTISFEEFMAGLNSGQVHQVGRLKHFMSKIGSMSKKDREEWDRLNGLKKSRRKNVMVKLQSVRKMQHAAGMTTSLGALPSSLSPCSDDNSPLQQPFSGDASAHSGIVAEDVGSAAVTLPHVALLHRNGSHTP